MTGTEILAKISVWGPVEWQQLCNWSPALIKSNEEFCYLRLQCQKEAWPTRSQTLASWLKASGNDSSGDLDKKIAGYAADGEDEDGQTDFFLLQTMVY